MGEQGEWFNTWFDSEYYHILYSHRDFDEAKAFIDALDKFFKFQPDQKALDAACGRGRHSIYLNEKGLDVTGIDISKESIEFARQFEKENLHFLIQDIRKPLKEKGFDYIFNLFTSFGYFEKEEDNILALKSFNEDLKPGGSLILDFLNPEKTAQNLVKEETRKAGDISFNIKRRIEDTFLIKDILFEDQGKKFHFYEKVRLIRKEEFLNYFNFTGFLIQDIVGNYSLEEYQEAQSERMIFIAEKK